MNVIYEDNHLLVINKPAGQLVQGDQTGRISLLAEAKDWLKAKYAKPGNVFLGLVHRLDRTASGVVVFARTSKAASRLSEEIRNHRPHKTYWALVEGETPLTEHWTDRLQRNEYSSQIVNAPTGKEARLSFKRLSFAQGISLVEINLETGRHHQIRVQFSHRGFFLLGDRRYGSQTSFAGDAMALHARKMVIRHPVLREEMSFVAAPAAAWQKFIGTLGEKGNPSWQVYRLDDNGGRFTVAQDLSEQEADTLIRQYEQRGHKQTYCKEIQDA
jgi:RluA family pseudouridine synthase